MRTGLKMLATGQWRRAVVLLNHKLRWGYLDFAKAGLSETGLPADRANAHQASAWELDEVLRTMTIKGEDRIIDIGCGKGGAMVTMAHYPFRRIAGLDLSPELVKTAGRNLSRLRLRGRSRLFCLDAATFTELDEYTHIYFFHPFPCHVMKVVMENIRASLARRPRDLTIVYNRPVCGGEVLAGGEFAVVSEHQFPGKAPVIVYAHRARAQAPQALSAARRKTAMVTPATVPSRSFNAE